MRSFIVFAASAAALAAGPSLAQTTTPPQTATPTQPATTGQTGPAQPGTAAPTGGSAGTATGPTTPTAGSQIHDAQGMPVGSVVSVAPNAIVVDTGAHKVGLPPNAVGPDGKGGFVSSVGKAQLDAAFEAQTAQADAKLQTALVPGASVSTAYGAAQAGTVKALDDQYVTLTTDKGDVKLPRNVFGLDQSGKVIVRLTAEQFTAALSNVKPAP